MKQEKKPKPADHDARGWGVKEKSLIAGVLLMYCDEREKKGKGGMERTLASQSPMHAMLLVVGMCRFKCFDTCEGS